MIINKASEASFTATPLFSETMLSATCMLSAPSQREGSPHSVPERGFCYEASVWRCLDQTFLD